MIEPLSRTLEQAGYDFDQHQQKQLYDYFQLLALWNKRINLTAVNERDFVTHHLLDSLSIVDDLYGTLTLDLGTGGGLPGVVLAIACPDKHFTLLDARNKKIQFLNRVKSTLSAENIMPVHDRVEDYRPADAFDTIVTRAFAQLGQTVALAKPLLAKNGRIIAMKGRFPEQEIKQLDHIGIKYEVKSVDVYGLDAQRHIVTLYNN